MARLQKLLQKAECKSEGPGGRVEGQSGIEEWGGSAYAQSNRESGLGVRVDPRD